MSFVWRWLMEPPALREKELAERVGSSSVSAQKLIDEWRRPEHTIYSQVAQPETFNGPMRIAASADYKHHVKGQRSTFAAAMCYATEYQQRRDELLAKYAAEAEAAAAAAQVE